MYRFQVSLSRVENSYINIKVNAALGQWGGVALRCCDIAEEMRMKAF